MYILVSIIKKLWQKKFLKEILACKKETFIRRQDLGLTNYDPRILIPTALHIDFIAACCLLAHGSTLVLLYAAVPSAALGGTAPH